jgi:hypothetical protein
MFYAHGPGDVSQEAGGRWAVAVNGEQRAVTLPAGHSYSSEPRLPSACMEESMQDRQSCSLV